MSGRGGKHGAKLNRIVVLLVAAVIAFCLLGSMEAKHGLELGLPRVELPYLDTLYDAVDRVGEESQEDAAVSARQAGTGLEVHMIDVGQGKSLLIRGPEKNVLIDAGENGQGEKVLRYLKAQGVGEIDILIATHPHSDHIGGLDTVIQGIPVGLAILPEIPENAVPATKTYTDLLEAILRHQVPVESAQPGSTHSLGEDALLTILGPVEPYEDLNNLSVVAKVTYGDTAFLFTGDAEARAETALLEQDGLAADVLDVGHHGSDTSSSRQFLDTVAPRIALISCGMDNSYGHPHREVMERLQGMGAEIYRTDLQGTVVAYSDGASVSVQTEK